MHFFFCCWCPVASLVGDGEQWEEHGPEVEHQLENDSGSDEEEPSEDSDLDNEPSKGGDASSAAPGADNTA